MFVKCFASGTNIQRIAKNADNDKIDCVLDVTYSQLEATEPSLVKRKFWKLEDDTLYDLLESQFKEDHTPSWAKIWAKPNQCKDFLSTLFNKLVGNDDTTELSLDSFTDEQISGIMVFTSANNIQMKQAAKLINKALNNEWLIVALNGDKDVEQRYSNKTAQIEINNRIKEAKEDGKKGVIILSNTMGSRSFSIPDIQVSLIMYDNGSIDATSQKVSRCLTPGKTWDNEDKTYGHIVTLSFDPNRCELVEEIVLYEALQLQRSEGITFDEAIKYVNKSVSIFKVSDQMRVVKVSEADLFKIYSETDNLLKIADVTVDVPKLLNSEAFELLSDIKVGKNGNQRLIDSLAPKTKKNNEITDKHNRTKTDEEKRVRQMEILLNQAIKTLNRSATTVRNMTMGGDNYRQCIENVILNTNATKEFLEIYSVEPKGILWLLDQDVLNTPLLDVIVQHSKNFRQLF